MEKINHLIEAQNIIATNKTGDAARDLMTVNQRKALADDYAEKNQYQSAAHFELDKDRAKEYETKFWSQFECLKK